jgi:hypothetical protein
MQRLGQLRANAAWLVMKGRTEMIQKFSGVTDPHNIEERKDMPFHWHPNVYTTGNMRDYLNLCEKITGTIGMYVHPFTVAMDFDYFPPSRFPIGMVKPDWYLLKDGKPIQKTGDGFKYLFDLDLRIEKVRAAIVQWIVLQAKILDRGTLCIDNISYNEPCGPVSAKDWTDTLRLFIQELRQATEKEVVINIGAAVNKYDAAIRDFGQIVDGVLLENPFHPNMETKDPGHAKELNLYRWYTYIRRRVLLMPPESRYDETCKLVDGIQGIYVTARKG